MCLFVPVKQKRKGRSKKYSSCSTSISDPPATRPVEQSRYHSPAPTAPIPVSFYGRLPESYWDDDRMNHAYINNILWQETPGIDPPSRKPKAVDILSDKIEKHQELTKTYGDALQNGFNEVSEVLDKIEGNLKAAIKATDDNVKLTLDATIKGTDAAVQALETSSQEEKDRRTAKQNHRQQEQQEAKLEEAQNEVLRLQGMLKEGHPRNILLELDGIKKEMDTCRQRPSATPTQPFEKLLSRLEDLMAEVQRQGARANQLKDEEQPHWQSGFRHHLASKSRDSGNRHRCDCDCLPSYHYHYHGADEEPDWQRRAPPFFGHCPSHHHQHHSAR